MSKSSSPQVALTDSNLAGSPSRVNIDMQAVLDAMASLNPKPIENLTAAEARKQPTPADGAKLVMKNKDKDPDDKMGVTTKDIITNGATGELPARLYIPDTAQNDNALPIVLYFHGGGWVIADLDTYDASPRAIAKMANVIVISTHYRQAPEDKFPAAHDDAFAAYQWVVSNAKMLGGDPARIAVTGESAGGNLALNVAIMARDRKVQEPVHQVLVYPVAGVDNNTPSYQQNANAKPLNKAMMAWFVKNVIKNESDKQDSRLDIVGKANLTNLPSATIILAEIDPLNSEGKTLAEKMKQAGVNVNVQEYKGVTHEFFGMGAVVSAAKEAEDVVAKDLRKAFNT